MDEDTSYGPHGEAVIPERRLKRGPCLQELVARFNGYDKIPEEAWEEHDRTFKAWRADMLADRLVIGRPIVQRPIMQMTRLQIGAELRAGAEVVERSDADRERRAALWRRLDLLVGMGSDVKAG